MDRLGHETRRLFQGLRRRWLPEPDLRDGFLQSLESYRQLQDHLRENAQLHRLSLQMYADLEDIIAPAASDPSASESRSQPESPDRLSRPEIHEILHIIQTMEIAWMNARMADFDAHPLNRGWVAAFHRWSTMPAFRRAWPVLRADFSRGFITYCESRFGLHTTYTPLLRWPSFADWRSRSEAFVTQSDARVPPDRVPQPSTSMHAASLRREAVQLTRLLKTVRAEFELEWPEITPSFFDDDQCDVWYVCPTIRQVREHGRNAADAEQTGPGIIAAPVPLGFIAFLRPPEGRVQHPRTCGHRSCDATAPELRFWVRPQYRFLGIGRHLLNQFAVQALRSDLPGQCPGSIGVPTARHRTAWFDKGPLVTRYFVRTGQENGQGLRRRMQLGFLYEYGFSKQDPHPYDELLPSVPGTAPHPSERGIDRTNTVNPQQTIVPSILRTTWYEFFESCRSMASSPAAFDRLREPTDHGE